MNLYEGTINDVLIFFCLSLSLSASFPIDDDDGNTWFEMEIFETMTLLMGLAMGDIKWLYGGRR